MQNKQQALAFLLKVSETNENQPKVKATSIIEAAIQKNAFLIEKYNPNIVLNDIPDVDLPSAEFQIIFSHLISNAIIYHIDGKDKRNIILSIEEQNEQLWCHVKDNGIGIEHRYHDDIFKTFRRLHGENLYEDGVGVGLTISKVIAQKYGGDINVKSEEGQGSTFTLCIPID